MLVDIQIQRQTCFSFLLILVFETFVFDEMNCRHSSSAESPGKFVLDPGPRW